jgi:hypothetical protein
MQAHTPYPIGYENATLTAISRSPHPAPDPLRLSQVLDQTLDTLILLHVAGAVLSERLDAAGVPPLADLEQERRRREASRFVVAS